MSAEAQLVIELWDAVRDFLPANKRADAALGIVRAVEDFGFSSTELADIVDEDDDLRDAYKEVFYLVDEEDEETDE